MTTKAINPARKRDEDIEKKVADLLPKDDENTLGKAYDPRLMRRLLEYMRPYKAKLVLAIILMTAASLLSVSAPWIVGKAIDSGIRAGSLGSLRFWIAVFAAAAVGEYVTNRGRVRILAFVGTKIVADVRTALFRHLHTLSLTFYNKYSVGRLMSRLISDVDVLQDFVTWSITGLARATFMLLGIVIAMLLLNWKLALVTFAVLPLMIVVTNYWRKRVRHAYRTTRERIALINGYLNESISGIRVTKSFTREEANFDHFDDLNRSYFNANAGAARLAALFFPAVDFIGSLATALVVGVGGWLIMGDALTPGVLVAFVLYVTRFFDPILELAQRYNTFQATMASSERMFALLDTAPDMVDAPDAVEMPPMVGHVKFDNVSFAYGDGEMVLRGVTLEARPGETGAGKSTIIRLLGRFFDLTDGALTIDGLDIRAVTQASLRRQLGIVLQDTFLFGGSVRDNIRYGRLDASDEQIESAARAVGAHDFIARLADGYETDVGENGVNLSVGQRQIISFARALLADPRLLILDEATSSVDTTTEKQIQLALETLMRGRTSFVIAHRLSTITSADKIVVLDKGQVAEIGTHEELLAHRGKYFNLYAMQWDSGRRAYSVD